ENMSRSYRRSSGPPIVVVKNFGASKNSSRRGRPASPLQPPSLAEDLVREVLHLEAAPACGELERCGPVRRGGPALGPAVDVEVQVAQAQGGHLQRRRAGRGPGDLETRGRLLAEDRSAE